jgi:predicted dehydrogenase
LKSSAGALAASTLASASALRAHAEGSDEIRVALVGCGGRGAGATANALSVTGAPIKLVAMADLFENKLAVAHAALSAQFGGGVEVPQERRFLGFDAYRRAMDCLRPGDVVALCTHAAFRAVHLEYAVQRGLHVFMEKSFAPDPAGIRRILQLGEEAERKNLKIATGLMCRHSTARQAMIQQIRNGAMGDITLLRAYRLDSGSRMEPWNGGDNELLWQIRHPYFFFWVSTGRFVDYMIHQVDECCWIKDAWPVSAHGLGGRTPGLADASQNFDTYAIEYTFADGSKAQVNGRFVPKCHDDFATFVHGTKCAAQFSGNVHAPTVQLFKDQRTAPGNVAWRPEKETVSPYQAEWNALFDAIRQDRPHNEVRRAAFSNLAALMGRAAVHTGRVITWAEAMASAFSFCREIAALTEQSPAPVRAGAEGRYPVPLPGTWEEI